MKLLKFIILFLSFTCASQNCIKKPGIYKTYTEFKNNSPSIELIGTIKSQNIDIGSPFSGPEIFTEYLLKIKKDESKKIGEIFGFSDGENFYVGNNKQTIYDMAFFKIELTGNQFYYFESLESFGNGIAHNKNIISVSTGKFEVMTVAKLKKLLKSKPDLYLKFKKTKKKDNHIKEFLIEYQKE